MRLRSQTHSRDIVSLAGWLFADLLLALTMLFLISGVTVTPIAKAKVAPTPTPPVLPRLELRHLRITLNIDANGILQRDTRASDSVEQQLRAQSVLNNRSAGLVIAYGGAPDSGQINTALSIASNVYTILQALGKQGYIFSRSSYYDPLFLLGGSESQVTLDIYLFAQ